jgi:hypothetical protein
MTRKDIIKDTVDLKMLGNLIDTIMVQQAYDKVGELFYVIQAGLKCNDTLSVELVSEFLDDLELRPVTSRNVGYEFRKPIDFDGFMYSQATDIFYAVSEGKLFKLPMYKRNDNAKVTDTGKAMDDTKVVYTMQSIEWETSEFSNINNTIENWVPATEYQIKKFNIIEKWFNMKTQEQVA